MCYFLIKYNGMDDEPINAIHLHILIFSFSRYDVIFKIIIENLSFKKKNNNNFEGGDRSVCSFFHLIKL
jgi:hypothetical protein